MWRQTQLGNVAKKSKKAEDFQALTQQKAKVGPV